MTKHKSSQHKHQSKSAKNTDGLPSADVVDAEQPIKAKQFILKKLLSTKKRKIITIAVSVLVLIGIVLAVPTTRYFVLGWMVKKDVTITILDVTTKRPISDAAVSLGDASGRTNKDGVALLKAVRVGEFTLKVTKQYYKDHTESYTVPVVFSPSSPTLSLTATGRQVDISVTNKITGDPVDGVVITASGTSATTNSEGTSVIILPATDGIQKATLTKSGYNSLSVDIDINNDTLKNVYSVTPSGSIYYLSKATGDINVMKANLDGGDAKVVVQATGEESSSGTSLLSARDWKYSALLAKRTDNQERLYLLDSSKDELSLMDEDDGSFDIVGWSGHNFIYVVDRTVEHIWETGRQVIKSFNAETRTLTALDRSAASPTNNDNSYQYETFGKPYILNDEIVYGISLRFYNRVQLGNNLAIRSANPATGAKTTVKEFPITSMLNWYYPVETRLYEPQAIYIQLWDPNTNKNVYYEYEDKSVKAVDNMTNEKFYNSYPTFLVSPSGKKTFWYEPRDGKNTLFIGDINGKNATQVGSLSEYTPYGWYGNDDSYILFTKNGSELYIASANKNIGESNPPLKVTDYHKTQTYEGYGYGYGGQ